MLLEALELEPEEGRLNFRMAELMRNQGELKAAIQYAETAINSGYRAGLLTLANILYENGLQEQFKGRVKIAASEFEAALSKVQLYKTKYRTAISAFDTEVADAIRSKILRAIGDREEALSALESHKRSRNPYVVYQLASLSFDESEELREKGFYPEALSANSKAKAYISGYRHALPPPLVELIRAIQHQEEEIELLMSQ